MCESWVRFPLSIPVDPEEFQDRFYIQVELERAEGISWRSVKDLTIFHRAGEMDEAGNWIIKSSRSYRHSFAKPVEEFADCSAQNVVNGHARILDPAHYEWVSDPTQSMPQWLALDFKTPTKINSVSIVFDTDMSNPGTCWTIKHANVHQCVRDYTVEVFTNSMWHKVADVTDNFMRKCTHKFPTCLVEKLRVTVLKTCGDPSARIIEIRAGLEL